MATAAANRPLTPIATENETRYKPYKKYTRTNGVTLKRKKRLFLQAGIHAATSETARTVFETLKALGETAPLKNVVVLPPDESGNLNRFIADNTTPRGLRFCEGSSRSGFTAQGVGGVFAERNPTKPDNILLTARRRADNLNSTQAFMTITPPRYEGESTMKIDLLCAKHSPEIDNVGAYLVAFTFLLCRTLGIEKITLGAVHDRVGYYKRLGFHVVPSHSSLVYMEMDVPPIEASNLVFEENENVGFHENYPSLTEATVVAAGGGGASTAGVFEEQPANISHENNVFGGTTTISNKNSMAAQTNNMSAFTRRTRRSRTK